MEIYVWSEHFLQSLAIYICSPLHGCCSSLVQFMDYISCFQDDIIRSLQSRLDIICDEADEDLDPMDDDVREASQERTFEKPVSRLVLRLLR